MADILAVNIGAEMLKIVPGRVSTEVRITCRCTSASQRAWLCVAASSCAAHDVVNKFEAHSMT